MNAVTTDAARVSAITWQIAVEPSSTHCHQVLPLTRAEVSSHSKIVPDSRRCLIAPVCAANAGALFRSMLASAPSLISTPKRSDSSWDNRSNGIAWPKRRYRMKVRRFGPNGEPGGRSAGAAALKRRRQHGQIPPCKDTRVTSGVIAGISIRS